MREPSTRAPLLWLLLPLLAGIVGASVWPAGAPVAALGGLACGVLALGYCRKPGSHWHWGICFVSAALICSWVYASARLNPPAPDWDRLPPREFEGRIAIERIWNSNKPEKARGLGRIVAAPPLLQDLVGQGVLFDLAIGKVDSEQCLPGARLDVRGVIARRAAAAGPGSFDAYLERQEVWFDLRPAGLLAVHESPSFVVIHAARAKEWLGNALLSGSDQHPELRALLPAMLLGDRALLGDEQDQLFRMTGMLHLFAVSGLHVGLIALTLNHLLLLLRLRNPWRAWVGLLLLLAYVLIIGATPSAIRAYLMTLFFWGGRAWLRESTAAASLVASAVAVLLWQPRQLFDPGFQLSYGIVAGIIFYGLPLSAHLQGVLQIYKGLPLASMRPLQRFTQGILNGASQSIGVAIGAFLASVPLSVQFFGVFAPGNMILNLMLSPVALLCVVAGTLAAGVRVLGLAFPFLNSGAEFLNQCGWMAGLVMQSTIEYLAGADVLFHDIALPPAWQSAVLMLVLAVLVCLVRAEPMRKRSYRYLVPPVALLVSIFFLALPGFYPP